MSSLGVQPQHIFHDIPDMEQVPLGKALLTVSLRIAGEGHRSTIARALDGAASDAEVSAAMMDIVTLVSAPRDELAYIEFLQWMGAAFTAAKDKDLPHPANFNQSQWNRALRDQGERLRAASLTLGSGREKIAAMQLEGFTQFVEKYGHYLPR